MGLNDVTFGVNYVMQKCGNNYYSSDRKKSFFVDRE